ncbi:MAG: SAM-dependent DNA methyltransferase [Paludibacteraceae bacterium]|nr:SAM-dependent DNA methyltransferase [Paludibacteraceae bacterium]
MASTLPLPNLMNRFGKLFDQLCYMHDCVIAGKSRRDNRGQFFTPGTVCDFMAQINADESMTGKGLTISDPTCGSGRTLLAFNAIAPGNYLYAEDIDRTCCMMTVCNFVIHGVIGEVIWHDSLDPGSFYDGWSLRRTEYPFPQIFKISKEESYVCMMWEKRAKEVFEERETKKTDIKITSNNQQLQLTLF